jgi:hypothetical protein
MNDLIVAEKIAGWEKLKALVLDSVSSPITKRVYNLALNEFLAWYQQVPRAGFTGPKCLSGLVAAYRLKGGADLGDLRSLLQLFLADHGSSWDNTNA